MKSETMKTIVRYTRIVMLILLPILFSVYLDHINTVLKDDAGYWVETLVHGSLKTSRDSIQSLLVQVEKFAPKEKDAVEKVTIARDQIESWWKAKPQPPYEELVEKENQFTRALVNLLAVVEKYPQLKDDSSLRLFYWRVSHRETNLSILNHRAAEYNATLEEFPYNLLARLKGTKRKATFEISANGRPGVCPPFCTAKGCSCQPNIGVPCETGLNCVRERYPDCFVCSDSTNP